MQAGSKGKSEEEIRWHKPVVYQEKDAARRKIAAHYVITNKNRVGFELAKYDSSKPLYIDPLIYSTYLGGSGYGMGIAVDSSGNGYLTGVTPSTGSPHAFVTKVNPTGSAVVYSAYLGGSLSEDGYGIAVDDVGNAYVTGFTDSNDFPVTPGAFQKVCGGGCAYGNAFVTEFNAAGSALVYSTYLGGSGGDQGSGIAVDNSGNAYVTGTTDSNDFPVTAGALQTTYGGDGDAFLTEVKSTGSALVYSTFVGGSSNDVGTGVALDSSGNAYVTGWTASTDFPTMNPLQPLLDGSFDVFMTKLNTTGSALIYSTFLGNAASGSAVAADGVGNAYVVGTVVGSIPPLPVPSRWLIMAIPTPS